MAGDGISIQFSDGETKSVTLYVHDGAGVFLKVLNAYVRALRAEARTQTVAWPLYRFEPSTVMIDFIRYLTTPLSRVSHTYKLLDTPHVASHRGHRVVMLKK